MPPKPSHALDARKSLTGILPWSSTSKQGHAHQTLPQMMSMTLHVNATSLTIMSQKTRTTISVAPVVTTHSLI
jgi:hypothetical protein